VLEIEGGVEMKEKMAYKYKACISYRKGTLVIMFINIALFFALNITPNLGDKLLLNPEIYMIIERPWTLITVLFSHEVHIHLIINMFL